MSYEPRTYRRTVAPEGLVAFEVTVLETDLQICAQRDLTERARELVLDARSGIESYIRTHPHFAESYSPLEIDDDAPDLVRAMAHAGRIANVGPMAAVAGAVAEFVARGLAGLSPEVIVENGGDVFLMGESDRTLALWAGDDGARGVGIRVPASRLPLAVCTSSGTFGHSTSFGAADTATVLAGNGALADAVVTALANRVRDAGDIERALEAAGGVHGVRGVVVTVGGSVGAWGDVHLVPVEG